jgi:UDP-N-acetylmuramate--alanine ligase
MTGGSTHLIGIGGIGISALARLLLARGVVISGTNDSESRETLDELRAQGVAISLDLEPQKLPRAHRYIYSDAWLTNHPEVIKEARSRGVPVVSFYEALGEIANESECVIVVAGAHGKTTTTAMLIDVLEAAGLNPTGWVGSLRAKTKSNFRAGGEKYFVGEADEYRRHFLYYTPKILIILNIDLDHLDYYQDLADIQSAFRELAKKVPKDGFVICNTSDERVQPIIAGLECGVVDYRTHFDPALTLKVLPLHRINAAAVLAVTHVLEINEQVARKALGEFTGTWRRFEYKGKTAHGAVVYDDYAHHPAEIATTLKSVREQYPDERIIVIFHPHLYSRTKAFMHEFATAFEDADEVLVAPIFAARETPDPTVTSEVLAENIKKSGKEARALPSLEAATEYLKNGPKEGDLVVTMGAGDIYKSAEAVVTK